MAEYTDLAARWRREAAQAAAEDHAGFLAALYDEPLSINVQLAGPDEVPPE